MQHKHIIMYKYVYMPVLKNYFLTFHPSWRILKISPFFVLSSLHGLNKLRGLRSVLCWCVHGQFWQTRVEWSGLCCTVDQTERCPRCAGETNSLCLWQRKSCFKDSVLETVHLFDQKSPHKKNKKKTPTWYLRTICPDLFPWKKGILLQISGSIRLCWLFLATPYSSGKLSAITQIQLFHQVVSHMSVFYWGQI